MIEFKIRKKFREKKIIQLIIMKKSRNKRSKTKNARAKNRHMNRPASARRRSLKVIAEDCRHRRVFPQVLKQEHYYKSFFVCLFVFL